MNMCISMHDIYIYIYIHIHTYIMPDPQLQASTRKGMTGVSANRVTANFMLFDRGTSWVLVCQNLTIYHAFSPNMSNTFLCYFFILTRYYYYYYYYFLVKYNLLLQGPH